MRDAHAEKKPPMIYSYVTRRLANGFSCQIDENKKGAFYIELKVYKCAEIERIQPVNRWRHSVITIKNKTNEDSESWRHLNEFIISTRRKYTQVQMLYSNVYKFIPIIKYQCIILNYWYEILL